MSVKSLDFDFVNEKLVVLDQLLLPQEARYIAVDDVQSAFDAITKMQVRGAPAIAIVAAFGVALQLATNAEVTKEEVISHINKIVSARPTAVTLHNAGNDMLKIVEQMSNTKQIKQELFNYANRIFAEDMMANRTIGKNGLEWVKSQFSEPISVITICNTGSLATAGYGTALGVVRSLHEAKLLKNLYILETRPYNQGSRLTAYETVLDNIPSTLITDSMAAHVMKTDKSLKLAIAGADRIALNGDVANKIGTYELAIVSKFHNVKFMVCAAKPTFDKSLKTGAEIPIEERPENELTEVNGQRIAAEGVKVFNPAFDVTPHELIDVVISN